MRNVTFIAAAMFGITLLTLQADANKAEEIIVTATRTKQEIKDISGNATLISSLEIKESNSRTVDDILKYQGGIDIQGGGFFGSKIRMEMRGVPSNYGPQRVLVMMDNRPVNEEYLGDVDFRFLPVDNVERVEIVRGPASALYGSNAVGGVINLITKSGRESPILNLATNSGSFNTSGATLQHARQTGSLAYFISAGEQTTDGYIKNSDGTAKNWSTQNISTRGNWQVNDESSVALSVGINNGKGIEENFTRDQNTNYLNLSYQTKLFNTYDGEFTARVYRNGLKQDLEWKFGAIGTYDQSTLGTQLQQSIQPIENHLVTFGIDAKQQDVLVSETNGIINETVNSQAAYVQDEIVLSENPGGKSVIGTVGLRYDQHEEFGSAVSPRFGVVYHLNEQTSLRTAVGKGYREPTVSDMFLPLTPYGPITFQGNANVNPETLWSYELGIDHKFAKDLSARLTLYQSQLDDAWDYMRDTDNIYRPHNVTQLSMQGIEAEVKYGLTKELFTFANYTYTDAKYKKDKNNPSIEGNYVEEVPRNQGNLGLRFQPENSTLVINLRANGAGERFTDTDNTRANTLPKHLVATAGVSSGINKNSSLFVTVHNLFDRTYKEVFDYYQPGRWFDAGLSIQF
ncbi:MAG: TonB-dependent receptor [Planctomycetes bacterium]|nr:TonB-dependent receptor [Planctomycetota bacterium]